MSLTDRLGVGTEAVSECCSENVCGVFDGVRDLVDDFCGVAVRECDSVKLMDSDEVAVAERGAFDALPDTLRSCDFELVSDRVTERDGDRLRCRRLIVKDKDTLLEKLVEPETERVTVGVPTVCDIEAVTA